MKHNRPAKDKPAAPQWLVTYGDMMTLLLAFFVMIVAYSSVEHGKLMDALESFRGAVGILNTQDNIEQKEYLKTGESKYQEDILTRIQKFQESIHEAALDSFVWLELNESGINIRLGDRVLFDLGKAELKPKAFPILASVARAVEGVTRQIYVEGHTDNVPINTPRFPSNWELSSARALSVVKYLYQSEHIPAEFLVAAGHGEHRPLRPNDTASNRMKNRRVEILVTWK